MVANNKLLSTLIDSGFGVSAPPVRQSPRSDRGDFGHNVWLQSSDVDRRAGRKPRDLAVDFGPDVFKVTRQAP
jgi:hypothetical protein